VPKWLISGKGCGPGNWLNAQRAHSYSLIFLAIYLAAIVGWAALSSDLVDRNGKPVGTDHSNV
jgi:alpha-1,2-mannosyltransferase